LYRELENAFTALSQAVDVAMVSRLGSVGLSQQDGQYPLKPFSLFTLESTLRPGGEVLNCF